MSNLTILGDTSGSVVLQAPAIAGSGTVNIPTAASGTMMVSGNMPTFSAQQTGNQTVSANTWTKMQCGTKNWDTNNCYDATTNYRFTPTVAGYYIVNGRANGNTGAVGMMMAIYKNGSNYLEGQVGNGVASTSGQVAVSGLVYLNGTTDYIELYGYCYGGTTFYSGVPQSEFSAAMVRAA